MLLSQANTDMLLLNVGFTFHNNITYIRSTFRPPYLKKGGSKKWSLRITTQILDQLRVTSAQIQEIYPYIARNGKGLFDP